ncbi:hypothetical protein BD770DRAFT_335032, partial [Pilaira anomala]
VTSRSESQREFFKIISTQFPNRWGVAFHMEGTRKVVEINFLKDEDTKKTLEKGLLFVDTKERILPTPSMKETAQVVRLQLSQLPFLSEDEIQLGLRHTLSQYG